MKRKTLHLNVKKEWFFMILDEIKKEEYRSLKPYYFKKLFKNFKEDGCIDPVDFEEFQDYDTITFSNGFAKTRPQFVIEFNSISIGAGLKEWGAKEDEYCFCIGLGEILSIGRQGFHFKTNRAMSNEEIRKILEY